MSDDNSWHRSITIPAEALEPTPEEQARYDAMLESTAKMGRSAHFSLRKMARDAGLTTLPGSVIYVGSRGGPKERIARPEEDLSVMLDGEAEWLEAQMRDRIGP